jgi:heme/copper-type cytochrome/quinol oxidase subunit 2
MGLIKLLLKAIIIPIVLLLVITVAVVFYIKIRREKKREQQEVEAGFQPPPIQQWVPYTPVQQPAPVYAKTPGATEHVIAHP